MGTLAVDASSPASTFTSANQTNTTASFTPPANSLLVACLRYNTGSGNTPTNPSITDSLGTHLTYTLQSHARQPDSPSGADSADAFWTAPVATSAAMTVSTTHTDAATGSALKVVVVTDSSGGFPGVGTIVKGGTTSAINTITVNVLATATGSLGMIGFSNWDATGIPVAGTGCTTTTGDAADVGTTLAYAMALRSSPDGVSGVNTPMILNSLGGAGSARWIAWEITPAIVTDTPPTTPGTPGVSSITTTTAAVTWTASTDDNAVSYYEIVVVPD